VYKRLHDYANYRRGQTYVESGLIFFVDNEFHFTERCLRLRMTRAKLVTLVEHAAGDNISGKFQSTCSHSRDGECLQVTFVSRFQYVLNKMSKNL